jgi:hypothetical protein
VQLHAHRADGIKFPEIPALHGQQQRDRDAQHFRHVRGFGELIMADFFLFDGAYHVVNGPLPDGAVAVDRLPEAGETWDASAGTWRKDALAEIEVSLPAGHIDYAHAAKALEAAAILSGVDLSFGFLAEEAAALGIRCATWLKPCTKRPRLCARSKSGAALQNLKTDRAPRGNQ